MGWGDTNVIVRKRDYIRGVSVTKRRHDIHTRSWRREETKNRYLVQKRTKGNKNGHEEKNKYYGEQIPRKNSRTAREEQREEDKILRAWGKMNTRSVRARKSAYSRCVMWCGVFSLAFLLFTFHVFFPFSSFPFFFNPICLSFVSSCLFLVGIMLSPRFRFLLRLV